MNNILTKTLLLVFLLPLSVFAQQAIAKDSLLDHLTGSWVLKGTIDEGETTHDIVAEWVLDHQYVQIKEVSREKDSTGKPLYEAIVYISFDTTTNRYACLWLDNTGNGGLSANAVGHAIPSGDKLPFLFKGSDYSFHTTFAYNREADTWQWIMDSEVNGTLQPFARVSLIRI